LANARATSRASSCKSRGRSRAYRGDDFPDGPLVIARNWLLRQQITFWGLKKYPEI